MTRITLRQDPLENVHDAKFEFGYGGCYTDDVRLLVFPSREHAEKACRRYLQHVRESSPEEFTRLLRDELFTPDSWETWTTVQAGACENTWSVDHEERELAVDIDRREQLYEITGNMDWLDEKLQPVAYLRQLTVID